MNIISFIRENSNRCVSLTLEHIWIVALSVFIATIIAVPVGIFISRNEKAARKFLNAANILMTIPSIALFGLMLPVLSVIGYGLGKVPAVLALVLYSQLPIIRNTYVGIKNVPPELINAAKGIGMNKWTRLIELEIPLAIPVIIAGLALLVLAAAPASGGLLQPAARISKHRLTKRPITFSVRFEPFILKPPSLWH